MRVAHAVVWRQCSACAVRFGTSTEQGMTGMRNKRCEDCRASGRMPVKPMRPTAPARPAGPTIVDAVTAARLVDGIIADLRAMPDTPPARRDAAPPPSTRQERSTPHKPPPTRPPASPSEAGRRCSRCHTLYPPHLVETAFRLDVSRRKNWSGRKWTCRPCEQTGRDEHKADDRWMVKARDVVRRHVDSLQKHHPGVTKTDLIERYGWDPARLSHDAEHQYGNGCNYCGHQYKTMNHGLADITLDVIDPKAAPYYRTNTKWCCMTCNRKKGGMSPEQFEQDRQVFELWAARRARPHDPLTDDPNSLFHAGG